MSHSRILGAVLGAALLVPAGASAATASGIDVHTIFGGGSAHAGAPVYVAFHRGALHSTQVCWSPAPVDRPACSASKFGVPARAGTQKLTLTLSDGSTRRTTLAVAAAATKLPGTSGGPARPMHVTCETTLYGNGYDGRLRDDAGPIPAGGHVAAYYRVPKHPRIVQVWDDTSANAGFISDRCLKPGF